MSPSYYYTLGIKNSASAAEVKRAYRRLALKYHPDKNPDASASATAFLAITEAYSVLSDPKKKSRYDLELLRSGFGPEQSRMEVADPGLLQTIANDLVLKLAAMDRNSISPSALTAYMKLILSDAHLDLLNTTADPKQNIRLCRTLIPVLSYIDAKNLKQVTSRLYLLTKPGDELTLLIQREEKRMARNHFWDLLKPWLIMLAALAACYFIFRYGRKK